MDRYTSAMHTVKQDDAARIVLHLAEALKPYEADIHAYAKDILRELETMQAIKAHDETFYAQTCVVFAIISPQCWIDRNIRAAQRFMAHIDDDFQRVEDVFDVITDNGNDSWVTSGMAARSLFKSLDFIRTLESQDMHKEILMAYKKAKLVYGLGQKTASMACALFDATEEVYTLDVHMLRFLQKITGGIVAGRMGINDLPYRILEPTLVQWHKETFPQYPIFVSQWALWCVQQGVGFISHVDIFAKGT